MQTPPSHDESRTRDAHDEFAWGGLLAGAAVHPEDVAFATQERARRRRRHRLTAFALALLVLVAATAIASQVAFTQSGGSAAPTLALSAEATGVLVIRPGEAPQRIAVATAVDAGRDTAGEDGAAARHALGDIAVVERAAVRAGSKRSTKHTVAAASVQKISLFGGRVVLDTASLEATADSRDGRASGVLRLGAGSALTIDGVPTKITANQKIGVAGSGTVLVNEQAVLASAPRGDEQTGPRARVVGALVHVRLTSAQGDVPAGTQILIGRVDAGVREGKVREVAHPGAATTPETVPQPPAGSLRLQPGTPRPGDATLPRQSTSVRGSTPPSAVAASLQGYTFPVLGSTSYTNDWGGPRASTGIPHQGTDVFAGEGTPIVAVADGVLDRVGWNSIGGYRFWLFDRFGNAFYHAHLSAYAPLAQDGAQVKAGDVIGFVGHTGDAAGTPPHLHFEVHPGNASATNPFPFLNAWKRGVAVAIGLLAGGEQKPASLALLGFTDISANSGLQDSVLDTVPDTTERPVTEETLPKPTDETLKQAIEDPGTTPMQ